MNELYLLGIVALLPLSALVAVCQRNPYHALVSRGILGVVAALVYAVLGAADVALTEALMGTLLTIMLYGVAVRSCLVVRLGWLATGRRAERRTGAPTGAVLGGLRACCRRHHLRLKIVSYPDPGRLAEALRSGKVDAACGRIAPMSAVDPLLTPAAGGPLLALVVRSAPLLRLLQPELDGSQVTVRPFHKTGFAELP